MTELRREIALNCPRAHAFRVFTAKVDLWWPKAHRKWTDSLLQFEAEAGGRLFERGADGGEWVMARVLEFHPPERLVMDWFPGSPQAPTQVTVTFTARGAGTSIEIVHRPVSAEASAVWPERVALFERGWTAVLAALGDWIARYQENAT